MQATAAKACRAPAPEKKVQIMSREYRGDFVVYTIASSSGCPGYFTYPFFYNEAYVYSVRTNFLCHIVNWQKRGYTYCGQQRDLLPQGVRNSFCRASRANHVTCFAERRKKRVRPLLPGPLILQVNHMKPAVRPM